MTSTSPASKACTAVVPSEIIRPLTRWRLTSFAFRQSGFLTRSMRESCCQLASLNGPSVTMFFASVHLSPYFSTVFLLTARNDVWATCWTNHGCGEVSLTCERVRVERLDADLVACSASQFDLQELYSCAPTMPKNWYA